MKHLMIKVNGKNLAQRVNLQQNDVSGIFDHYFQDTDDLNINIDNFIKDYFENENAGDEIIYKFIDDSKINETGHYTDENDDVWLTIATMNDLRHEVKQELEYQKNA